MTARLADRVPQRGTYGAPFSRKPVSFSLKLISFGLKPRRWAGLDCCGRKRPRLQLRFRGVVDLLLPPQCSDGLATEGQSRFPQSPLWGLTRSQINHLNIATKPTRIRTDDPSKLPRS